VTGPGPGKIRLRARVVVCMNGCRLIDAHVYLHVRGYSRAFVTHIDVEASGLEDLVGGVKRGVYGVSRWSPGLLVFEPYRGSWRLMIYEDQVTSFIGVASCPSFMGGKWGGVFIGFKKSIVRKLEEAALKLYNVKPKGLSVEGDR